MRPEDCLDFLGPDAIRIRGFRIGIEQVLGYYLEGWSPEQIAQELPGLTLEEVHATIAYYWHNKAEVDAYLERVRSIAEAEYRRWTRNSSPTAQRLRALKAESESGARREGALPAR